MNNTRHNVSDCWLYFLSREGEGIKMKDGGYLKLNPYLCPHSMECVETLSDLMLDSSTTRMTPEGLLTDSNPSGVDLVLDYLGRKCQHPQRELILKHTRTLDSMKVKGIVIPKSILRLIERSYFPPSNDLKPVDFSNAIAYVSYLIKMIEVLVWPEKKHTTVATVSRAYNILDMLLKQDLTRASLMIRLISEMGLVGPDLKPTEKGLAISGITYISVAVLKEELRKMATEEDNP